ncbi:Trm82 protein [Saccharomycopsis crataegensis]|uniref:Trm82 protein n=1 Tax=Saccharomycopsis crataegensis TaxID=43959 RepID=A0AAV5QHR0_9ASCO|nr:Trm82 protein [Saccharomycopsis crataegensis]
MLKHPFSSLVINKEGTLLFVTVQNNILVYELQTKELLDRWTDEVSTDFVIKKKFEKIIEEAKKKKEDSEKEEKSAEESSEKDSNAAKKQKLNSSKAKIPKIPTPGPGAPQIFNDVRNLYLTPSEKYLIVTTNSDKAVVIFKLHKGEKSVLELIKRQPFPKRPCSVSVSRDEKQLVLGDKFGDVYSIAVESPIIEDLGESNLDDKDEAKLPTPILGHVSMLTNVMMTVDNNGKEKLITGDRDEHIRISNFPKSYVIDKFCFGHREFVSELLIPEFDRSLLISGGGDEFVLTWDWLHDDKPLQKIDLKEYVTPYLTDSHLIPVRWVKTEEDKTRKEFCVAKIAVSEKTRKLVVLPEQTRILLVFKFDEDRKKFEFEKLIEDDDTISCMTVDSMNDKVYYGVDNKKDLVKVLDLDGFSVSKYEIESPIEVEDEKALYPLYNIGQLRKRSEH